MTLLAIAARYLGVTGIVALGIVLFYEGVPLGPARYIPYVGPALADLVDGRVDREYARGFAEAGAACREAQRLAELEYLRRVQETQAALDELAAEYRASKEAVAIRVKALLDTIEAIETEEANATPDAPACRRFIPRRVSNQIDAIR